MCLAALAIDQHPDFPFICLANRDEFHNRPTSPLQPWPMTTGTMWAGKDLQSGGTWLGVGSNAEFALLTNVRNSTLNMPGTAPSRGKLVLNAIHHGIGPSAAESAQYAGFNLIHGNLRALRFQYTSNQGLKTSSNIDCSAPVVKGIYAISNGYLDAPWPKTRLLKQGLMDEISASGTSSIPAGQFEENLFSLLNNTGLAEDSELPSTGVPYEWEKMLSAVKIISPVYGTRSSAVILLDRNNIVHFTEITFDEGGNETGRKKAEVCL